MIGQRLGSFQIESKIGSGAMGVVFRGLNVNTGKPAAIKIITAEYARKGNASERFQRETEILQQFRHPNIVRLLAVGRYQKTDYFAMEFIEGKTLEALLEEVDYLPWEKAVEIALQTTKALHYAHERGVVHRDLKPSNLLLTASGEVKLADFGIAKDLDATALTDPGRTLGTAAYMAPEQIRGVPAVSHKTDLYSLGVVLFQMLTGKLPYPAGSVAAIMHAHLTAPVPRASDKNPEIPVAIDDLVFKLMAKEPQDRPWDAQAVEVSLGELLEKATRNDAIAMVRAEMETVNMDGLGLKNTKDIVTPKKKKKKRKKKGDDWDLPISRTAVGTAGLVLALVGALALVAYLLWPPSAKIPGCQG